MKSAPSRRRYVRMNIHFLTREEDHADFVEEAQDLRLLLGVIPAIGQGVKVTLERC